MSRILVSILSKHTLPNYLFIKEMEGQYDELVFVTTAEVDKDKRDVQIEKALGLKEGEATFLSVDGNDYRKTLDDLASNWDLRAGDKYIVNITGGTKLMSLAVYEFFGKGDASFYYVPNGKNVYYNLATGETQPIAYRASLKEYFSLYGIRYESVGESTLLHSKKEVNALYRRVLKRGGLLGEMRHAQEAKTPELRRYWGGGWFEEFCYYKIKRDFDLNDKYIALSLKIYRNDSDIANDNEIDVAFMKDNVLNVVECKVSMRGEGENGAKDVVEKFLYKLAAVSKDFGLSPKTYLFTLHKIQDFPEQTRLNISKRCRILGIGGIVWGDMFLDLKKSLQSKKILTLI